MNNNKKIWSIISTVPVVLVVLCAVFLMGARLLGFRCYNIISPSMEPKYSVGDLIYVKKVDPYTIQPGDVITFVVNEDLVVGTHRVMEVDLEKKQFITKGDANQVKDAEPVSFNNVIGVPKFSIPKMGYVSDFVQNPPGMYIAIGVGIAVILAVFLPDMVMKKKKETAEAVAGEPAQPVAVDPVVEENERLKAELEQLKAKLQSENQD